MSEDVKMILILSALSLVFTLAMHYTGVIKWVKDKT